ILLHKLSYLLFFFTETPTTEIYTLSLHDALPICMPVGAYGGKQEIMDYVSPVGPVYQAGTLSGNPIAMAAGHAMLSYLKENPATYSQLDSISNKIVQGIRENLKKLNLDYTINHFGSMFSLFFTNSEVNNFEEAKRSDTALFGRYFRAML